MGGVESLTSQTLDEVIGSSEVPVLVEVGAGWCPPCRAMEPVLAAMSAEQGHRLRIFTVDADDNPGVVARFGVFGLPTLLAFRDGRLVTRLVGARSRRRLTQELAELLS